MYDYFKKVHSYCNKNKINKKRYYDRIDRSSEYEDKIFSTTYYKTGIKVSDKLASPIRAKYTNYNTDNPT